MVNSGATSARALSSVLMIVGASFMWVPTEVWAAAAAQTTGQRTFGAGLSIAWAIAYLSRRRAIGGWLLYFYIQLYLSLLLSFLFLPATIGNLRPSEWDNSKLYVLNLISVVPVLPLMLAEAYAATMLLARRTEANVKILRKVLIGLSLASGIALGIDIAFFAEPPTLFFDTITFVFALIWLAYFYKATRVRLVFVECRWNYETHSAKRVLSPEDRRRLRRRALLASTITFVVLLVMMGLALNEKKPDASIFFFPLFYAAIAALIAWYLPLRKRAAEGKSQPEPNVTPTP